MNNVVLHSNIDAVCIVVLLCIYPWLWSLPRERERAANYMKCLLTQKIWERGKVFIDWCIMLFFIFILMQSVTLSFLTNCCCSRGGLDDDHLAEKPNVLMYLKCRCYFLQHKLMNWSPSPN
jgi:hypothetical protein